MKKLFIFLMPFFFTHSAFTQVIQRNEAIKIQPGTTAALPLDNHLVSSSITPTPEIKFDRDAQISIELYAGDQLLGNAGNWAAPSVDPRSKQLNVHGTSLAHTGALLPANMNARNPATARQMETLVRVQKKAFANGGFVRIVVQAWGTNPADLYFSDFSLQLIFADDPARPITIHWSGAHFKRSLSPLDGNFNMKLSFDGTFHPVPD